MTPRLPDTIRSHAKPWFRDSAPDLIWVELPLGLVSPEEAARYGVTYIGPSKLLFALDTAMARRP